MRRIRRLFSALVIAGASWFSATPSFAAQPSPGGEPPPGGEPSSGGEPSPGEQPSAQPPSTAMTHRTKRITATATVVKVDAEKRHLMLRSEDGTEFTVEAPRSINLDRIHEGNKVKVDYYEAMGLSLKKPEPGAQPRADETTITRRNAGALPGGTVTHRVTATVEVVRVDAAGNRLTVKRPDGTVDTINVTEPAMRAQLGNVHEGDRIQLTYTEAAAIKVMPQAGDQSGQPSQPDQSNPPNQPNQPDPSKL
jgi:hypothetical protein